MLNVRNPKIRLNPLWVNLLGCVSFIFLFLGIAACDLWWWLRITGELKAGWKSGEQTIYLSIYPSLYHKKSPLDFPERALPQNVILN
jgi:hypothetical protein